MTETRRDEVERIIREGFATEPGERSQPEPKTTTITAERLAEALRIAKAAASAMPIGSTSDQVNEAAIRAVLESSPALEPQQEEPIAFRWKWGVNGHWFYGIQRPNTIDPQSPYFGKLSAVEPLYPQPITQQPVAITDEMVERAARAIAGTAYEGIYFTSRSREQYIEAEWRNHETDARTALNAALVKP